MAKRQINRNARSCDLDVGRDKRFTASNDISHRFAKFGMNHRPALFHGSVNSHDLLCRPIPHSEPVYFFAVGIECLGDHEIQFVPNLAEYSPMLHIRNAIVSGQARVFALVDVNPRVLDDPDDRRFAVHSAESKLGYPVVLAAKNSRGQWRVWGHRDNLSVLKRYRISDLTWRTTALSESSPKRQKQIHAACGGTGERECPTCDGRGRVIGPVGATELCPAYCRSGRVKCRPCDGKGYY